MAQMTGWHLAILAIGSLGFGALALATDRQGELLLGRLPAPRWRRLARITGWALLAVALGICVILWGSGVGITLFLGWLTIAGAALVFAIPRWSRLPQRAPRPARKAGAAVGKAAVAAAGAAEAEPVAGAAARLARQLRRLVPAALLALTVAVFVTALIRAQAGPLERADAVQGKVGPWSLILAEADRDPPEIVDLEVPLKAFRIRFCEACDGDIRFAFLKVNQPRSLRAAGMGFEGARWERRVEIQLPANVNADSELWLTVVGKDGSVHQTSWPLRRVSPASVAWFDNRMRKQSDE